MKVLYGVCLILGCFLGAGFVSGREIACYFSKYGIYSIISSIIASLIFYLLCRFFFMISSKVNNTNSFTSYYFGKVSKLINLCLMICVLIVIGSMIAGTFSLAKSLNLSTMLVLIITLVLAFFITQFNTNGITKFNTIFIPILISIMLICSITKGPVELVGKNLFDSVLNATTYIFINITSLGLLIIEIGDNYSKREKILISIISALIVCILLIITNLAILKNNLVDETMPVLTLAKRNSVLHLLMVISIYLGLFTTLISNVFVLSKFINRIINNYALSILLTLMSGLIISFLGFNYIVGYVYLFIGIIGIFIVLKALYKEKRMCKNFTHS